MGSVVDLNKYFKCFHLRRTKGILLFYILYMHLSLHHLVALSLMSTVYMLHILRTPCSNPADTSGPVFIKYLSEKMLLTGHKFSE